MPIFNIGLGMTPVAIGIILMLLRCWDGFLDPVIGYISDNFRTRWGRRRPYMVIGAIGCAAIYPVFWFMPADFSDHAKFIYLLATGMAFYTAYSCWSMPYYGLQLELTSNYTERIRLTAWMTVFYNIVQLTFAWNFAFLTSKHFANPVTGKPDLVHGIQIMCWFVVVLILIFGLAPALFVRERIVLLPNDSSLKGREPFWQNIKESLHNRPLWILIGISVGLVVGGGAVGSVGSYVSIYYVNKGSLAMSGFIGGWQSTILTLCGFAFIPFWTWLGRYYDKRTLVIATLLICMFGHLMGFFLITPSNPYLSIISAFFESAGFCAIWLFLPAMKGDVCDYDELHTGRRREGGINAFYAWFFKAALALSAGLSGWLLEATGFDLKINASDPVIHSRMFMIYILLPLFFWGGALALVSIYPLTRERMAAIRTELENRRGKVQIES